MHLFHKLILVILEKDINYIHVKELFIRNSIKINLVLNRENSSQHLPPTASIKHEKNAGVSLQNI